MPCGRERERECVAQEQRAAAVRGAANRDNVRRMVFFLFFFDDCSNIKHKFKLRNAQQQQLQLQLRQQQQLRLEQQ